MCEFLNIKRKTKPCKPLLVLLEKLERDRIVKDSSIVGVVEVSLFPEITLKQDMVYGKF